MSGMFWNCYNLINIDTSNFDTGKVTNFNYMFTNCTNAYSLDLSSFNTLNSDSFDEMFTGCKGTIVILQGNIENIENLIDVILDSDVNIRFLTDY